MHPAAKMAAVAVLAAVGAVPEILAAAPIRPTDPNYVVAELPGGAARAQQRYALELEQSRQDPRKAAQLARELLDEARATIQPQLFGRAESVLAPWVSKPGAPVVLLVMQADILQQRHEFAAATQILSAVIARDPGERQAHLMRANNDIVTGEFASARPDCAWLLGEWDVWTGSVCLAEVLGSTGQRDQARAMLERLTAHAAGAPAAPAALAWALEIQADLDFRAGSLGSAEQLLRQAMTLAPTSDPIRLELADVLAAEGQPGAAEGVLQTTRPSVGTLLRRMELEQAQGHKALCQQALAEVQERLNVSAERGERLHLREETRLALDLAQDPRKAVALARSDFAMQRETEDVRLLARAVSAAGDQDALKELKQWLLQTRYQDVRVEQILHMGHPT